MCITLYINHILWLARLLCVYMITVHGAQICAIQCTYCSSCTIGNQIDFLVYYRHLICFIVNKLHVSQWTSSYRMCI